MLEVTYAFIGFIMGAIALLISLYVWLTVDEMAKNGRAWVKLNQELKKKILEVEKNQRTINSPWNWKK
jgi:hypothetical protein